MFYFFIFYIAFQVLVLGCRKLQVCISWLGKATVWRMARRDIMGLSIPIEH